MAASTVTFTVRINNIPYTVSQGGSINVIKGSTGHLYVTSNNSLGSVTVTFTDSSNTSTALAIGAGGVDTNFAPSTGTVSVSQAANGSYTALASTTLFKIYSISQISLPFGTPISSDAVASYPRYQCVAANGGWMITN